MTEPRFPRRPDNLGHAWGLRAEAPREIWERFSGAYEARLERLAIALEGLGYAVEIGGAGGQDGEFIRARHAASPAIFQHLEDPSEANTIAALIDALEAKSRARG